MRVPVLFSVALLAGLCSAQETASPSSDLAQLSLEELMSVDIVVTSATRHEESLSRTAAAVYVITAEDIERSGATTLPELLRLAPGVDVARLDSNRWAVSIRGFTEEFANKLLVLVDGRSVYTPLFSGTWWDTVALPLELIERIEVIRGPGGPLWGANAVNGIINIITKHTSRTVGGRATVFAGNFDRALGYVRWGETSETGSWRVWGQYADRGETQNLGGASGSGDDAWQQGRMGFRADRRLSERDELLIRGDAYVGESNNDYVLAAPPPQYAITGGERTDIAGANLQLRWRRALEGQDEFVLHGYVDHGKRDVIAFNEERTNAFVESNRRWIRGAHDVTVGASVRTTHSATDDRFQVSFASPDRTVTRGSLFVQDAIELSPQRWRLLIGARVEHEDVIGFFTQPSVRLLFTPDERQTWWAAISRAVRTPSQAEQDLQAVVTVIPGAPDRFVTYFGDRDVDPETVDAAELGYRIRPTERVSIDAALYFKHYDDLIQYAQGAPFVGGGGIIIPFTAANAAEAESYGFELSTEWLVRDDTRLSLAWTVQQLNLTANSSGATYSEVAEGRVPESNVRLRVQHDFNARWRADAILWRVEERETGSLPGYWRMDASVQRRLGDRGTLSAGVQNVFHDGAHEFDQSLFGGLNESIAAFFVRLDLNF